MHAGPRFAQLPAPPNHAAIFSSQRTTQDEANYDGMCKEVA